MKQLFLFFLSFLSYVTFSQSTLIEYDYHADTYKYFKISKKGKKKEVKKPFAYKGVPVQVVVKDMNPYQYNITYSFKSYEEAPVSGIGGMETMLGGFSTFMGGLNGLGGSISTNPIYHSLFGDDAMDDMGNDRGLGFTDGYSAKLSKYNIEDRVANLSTLNKELVKQSKNITHLFDQLSLMDYTTNELIKLLYDPEMKHAEMKQRANEFMAEIMSDTSNITISSINADSKRKYEMVQNFMTKYNEFSTNSNNLSTIINGLDAKVGDEDDRESLASIIQTVSDRTREVNENYTMFMEVRDSLTLLGIRDKMMKVFEVYEMIKKADFNHEYSLKAAKDVTQLSLDFGINDNEEAGVVKTRVIDVPTSGGFKMNTSAGLSLFSYVNGNNSYINNAGTIEAVKGDFVRPAVSSMLHFYRQSHRNFMVGGSVGISIPLEGDKDLGYMAGVSGILGKKQRIIFNLGVMTGKTLKLTDGYNTGDVLPSEFSAVPTKRAFDLGVFFGVTFNISSMFGNNEPTPEPSADDDAYGFGAGNKRAGSPQQSDETTTERSNYIRNPYRPIIKPTGK